ncbi:MAG: NCS2 family permease [Verrucomicrobiae bacterium]|nr:NCS2 family permease [Verrucomicrobiae bacterium]
MNGTLDRFFRLTENRTTVRTEILAGLTTFLTMAYIIVVQPGVLSGVMFDKNTGMDFNSVMAATCLSAALATTIMALYARYPIAQAPGMGQNFFFVFTVIPAAAAAGFSNSWQTALGAVFISGVVFLILSLMGMREKLMDAIGEDMKHAIAVGIGLFIAFIGLQNASLIVASPGTLVTLHPDFASPDLLIFFFGLLLMTVLSVRGVKGAILWGILGGTLLAVILKIGLPLLPGAANSPTVTGSMLMKRFVMADAVVAAPPSLSPTLLKMDLTHALNPVMLPYAVIFLFMLTFDTIGTLVGIGQQAGFIKDNKLPRAKEAFVSDAVGTVAGAAMGTSTVTSYIESSTGVEQGGRTGLTGLVVAAMFLMALFFSPLARMMGSYAPITAPALVFVGAMMIRNVSRIRWTDYSEAIPAFLVILGIPLSYSISDGLALGFIAHPAIKILGGRRHETSWLLILLGVTLVLYFVFVRTRVG